MPYAPEHKQETRERIVRTARRLFNRKGFAEVTIDEIMAEAGLTRGGFYRHFKTKDELYSEALTLFLCKEEPENWQRKHVNPCEQGSTLARLIMDAYLSKDHFDDRDGSCPTAALPSDVSPPVKKAFRTVLEMMLDAFGAALPGPDASERALALVSLCVGAMVVARAVDARSRRRASRGRPQARARQFRMGVTAGAGVLPASFARSWETSQV